MIFPVQLHLSCSELALLRFYDFHNDLPNKQEVTKIYTNCNGLLLIKPINIFNTSLHAHMSAQQLTSR